MDDVFKKRYITRGIEVFINMDKDIKKAEEKLREYLSSDPVTQELYFEKEERALHEKANLINTGIRQGIKQEKIEMARKLLQNNFSGKIDSRINRTYRRRNK